MGRKVALVANAPNIQPVLVPEMASFPEVRQVLSQQLQTLQQHLVSSLPITRTLSRGQAAAFAFIWCGLVLYTADNLWAQPRVTRA